MNGVDPKNCGPKPGWRDSTQFLVWLGLLVGPFAIPFIWLSRKLSVTAKILWTVALVALAFALYRTTTEITDRLTEQLKQSGLL